MSAGLRLAPGLRLPLELVTESVAILAVKRAGKSHTAKKLTEQLHGAGQQVVVVDPKGDWWGLRSSADGKGPGLPLVIVGGEHGDVPLEPGAGELVAKLVVEQRVSLVLDLSELRKHQVATFMTAFLETLYRMKAKDQYRTPMMLVIDEADAIAPQRPMKGEERMLGAAEDIVRRGGQRGIGIVLVSQRAAVLNKNVLTQAGVLILLRTTGSQDIDAVDEWIKKHGQQEQREKVMAGIAALPRGEAWVWAPGWPTEDGIFKQVHVDPLETFDSGATPKPGQVQARPKTMADVDLDAFRREMATTIERAKQDDPKALRAEIGNLKSQLTKAQKGQQLPPAASIAPKIERVEVPALSADVLHRLEEASDRAFQAAAECRELYGEVRQTLEAARQVATARAAPLPRPAAPTRVPAPALPKRGAPSGEAGELGRAERAVLSVLAQHPDGCERGKLTLLTGYRYSGGFRNALGELRTRGLIEGGNDATMRITTEGMAAIAGQYEPLPSGPALLDYWLTHRSLGKAERAILGVILEKPDAGFTADDLTRATGYEYSGGFRNALGNLRTAGLIVGSNTGRMQANQDLFS